MPPIFAENRTKLVSNRQILSEIWVLTPHFWVLTPYFSVASEGPDLDIIPLVVRDSKKIEAHGAHRE